MEVARYWKPWPGGTWRIEMGVFKGERLQRELIETELNYPTSFKDDV